MRFSFTCAVWNYYAAVLLFDDLTTPFLLPFHQPALHRLEVDIVDIIIDHMLFSH